MVTVDLLAHAPATGHEAVRDAIAAIETPVGHEIVAMTSGGLPELDARLAGGDRLGAVVTIGRVDVTRQALRWLHDELPPHARRYDAAEVNRRLGILLADRARWSRWWANRHVAPLVVDFEALVVDPDAVARSIAGHLRLPVRPRLVAPEPDPEVVDVWHAHHCRLPTRRGTERRLSVVELRTAGIVYELVVDPDEFVGREILLTGRPYEAELLEEVARRLRPGSRVLDVGAHIGNHTVAFAALGHHVTSVEPNPASRRLLEANAERNGLTDRVTVVAGGAGRSSGAADLVVDAENTGATRLRPGTGPVAVHRLDDLVDAADLVKLDVEGAELDVLAGAERLLRTSRPLVLAEAHDDDALSHLRRSLAPFGYATDGASLASDPTYLFEPVDAGVVGRTGTAQSPSISTR